MDTMVNDRGKEERLVDNHETWRFFVEFVILRFCLPDSACFACEEEEEEEEEEDVTVPANDEPFFSPPCGGS